MSKSNSWLATLMAGLSTVQAAFAVWCIATDRLDLAAYNVLCAILSMAWAIYIRTEPAR